MANRQQRMKNRATAKWLERAIEGPCPECGMHERHWISAPYTLQNMIDNDQPEGFWTCPKFYGEDGRRLGT